MKKIKIIGLLFCGFSFALVAQVKLNVEGDTKITGKLELLQAPNNFSIIGTNAGQNDSGDNHSTFIGYNAGLNNTANDNTFLGYQAGEDNTTGFYNTFLGASAGKGNTESSANTIIGYTAGNSSKGSNNSFLGYYAGGAMRTGTRNTFIGSLSGFGNQKGSYNTHIGYNTGTASVDSLDKTIAIGQNARVGCHNCAVIGGVEEDAVKVGIGTTTPTADLSIVSNSGSNRPQISLTEVGSTDYARLYFGNENKTGYWTIAGRGSNVNTPLLHFYYHDGTNGTNIMTVKGENKRVGIGDTSPDCKLDVSGDICTNDVILTSDKRFKKNIKSIHKPIEKLMRLKGVSYQMRTQAFKGRNFLGGKKLGLIAQEVEVVFPELVKTFDDGYKGINYNGLIPVLVESIKSQQKIIDNQSINYENLTKKLDHQQKEIKELQALVNTLIANQTNNTPSGNYELTLETKASLSQNQPNPFFKNTIIHYTLPQNTKKAFLQITSINGKVIRKMPISPTDNGQITINANSYPSGTYLYSLVANGQVLLTKQMVLAY